MLFRSIEHEVDSILNVPRLIALRLPRVWGGPFDKDSFFAVSSSQIDTGGTLKINHRNPLRSFLHINQLYNSINCINVTHNNRIPKFFQIYNLADSTPSNLVQWISRVGIANEYRFQNMDQDRNISFCLNVSKFERDFGPIMPLNKIQALWV